eukprot:m.328523 g.328523  ORF g.328523 m.328523 type:complete len:99 (-) comp19753_c1_seq7:44-340(-)
MHKLEIVFPPRLRHVFGPQSKGSNEALTELRRLLVAQDAKGKLDGFACYLYGIVQRELGQRSEFIAQSWQAHNPNPVHALRRYNSQPLARTLSHRIAG